MENFSSEEEMIKYYTRKEKEKEMEILGIETMEEYEAMQSKLATIMAKVCMDITANHLEKTELDEENIMLKVRINQVLIKEEIDKLSELERTCLLTSLFRMKCLEAVATVFRNKNLDPTQELLLRIARNS